MLALVVVFHTQRPAPRPCPAAAAVAASAALDSASQAYRNGVLTNAARLFDAADSLCPGSPAPQVGLGFILLRQGRPEEAERRFSKALAGDSGDADAWYGCGLAELRRDHRASAERAFRRALLFAPAYADVVDQLLAAGIDSGLTRAPLVAPLVPQVPARTQGERFEVRMAGGWQPFYVKGINLGAALPGRFPSQFPTDDSTYARWLELMAGANANVVRLYTILPPAFYRALRRWNETHAEHALWLVQGVWAELPPKNDYDEPAWKADFRHEMRRAVDVIHGRGLLAARPGHAWGRFDADVSNHVLAFLLGREWEPFSIGAYDRKRAARTRYAGRFLAIDHGTPADIWLAEQCDYLLTDEWDRYRAQRPIAYTNWPTLDPLHHPTEAGVAEEQQLRRRYGYPPNPRLKEYDNDVESLDAMLVRTTPADVAGYFVVYHAYPYYPDFIALERAYGDTRSADGPSHYLGYLVALKRHYSGRPLLIAEYGVPSSRGLSHLGPEGMDHGRHDEREMAALDARLTREIHEAGLAGGIVFSWLDEWFKHTWITIDLELPPERTRLWHNVMDAEQNFGMLAEEAGDGVNSPSLGGEPGRWRGLSALERSASMTVRVGADASYLYLALDGGSPLDSTRYVVGIATAPPDRGESRLPGLSLRSDVGFEFALVLNDTTDAELLVTPSYNLYLGPRAGDGPTALDAFYNAAATIAAKRTGGGWDSLFVTTNRWRIGRDGTPFPARGVNSGRLRYGRADASTLVDWYVDRPAGLVEVRLAWGLLNVTDPSSRRIVRRLGPGDMVKTTVCDGVRVGVAVVARATGAVLAWLPASAVYLWPTWEAPVWHERVKPVYAALRGTWGAW